MKTGGAKGQQRAALDAAVGLEVVVGLPAYNEAVGIGSTILAAQEFADEVVVVDDGSTDRTADIARSTGATVIEHDTNRGKGGAIQTLFKFAKTHESEVFVILDADGQHLPEDIPRVVEPVVSGKADIVIGSRYLESGAGGETPLYRRVGQRVLDVLTIGASGPDLTDTQSGFRAFSPSAIERLDLTTNGIGIETEMIRDASEKELTIVEVPIAVRYNGIDGQTYNPLYHGFSVVNFALGLVRDRHPLLFFGIPGLLLVFFGSLYGIEAILVYRATNTFYPAKVLVSGFVTIFGTLLLFMGLTLHSLAHQIEKAYEAE